MMANAAAKPVEGVRNQMSKLKKLPENCTFPQLAEVIAYIHAQHPEVLVILDAKRGDIGSTAEFYAREAFERYVADAVTVNPYLGPESLAPYLAHRDRGVAVLCRTSNPQSEWLQSFPETEPTYLRVARAAADCEPP